MRTVAPKFRDDVDWIEEVPIAETQHEYLQVTGAIVEWNDGTRSVFARWTFTPEERTRIAAGEDIYISFPSFMAPHNLQLRPDWADSKEGNDEGDH